MLKKLFLIAYFSFFATALNAGQTSLKPFVSGSYQQLLQSKADKPFMLVIWSVTCSSCLKDMALLNRMHKAHPDIDMVMLSTDDNSASEEIQQILSKSELAGLENWLFGEDNAQKLRYEIDSKWYGEMPRTYFFDKDHERTGISGVIGQKEYEDMFKKMLN